LTNVPSRNEPCPCGSALKYKRCCLERFDAAARELRERDAVLEDVIAWVRDEHRQTLRDAGRETTLIRLLRGRRGRNMSLVWALTDFMPADGGPPLMARYAARPDLSPSARTLAYGLARTRLEVYRVQSTVGDIWLEIEPLVGGPSLRISCQEEPERPEVGDILVARVVTTTAIPTLWGLCERFAADGERRWLARLAALPTDPAQAALTVLGFHPDDAAEPPPDGLELHAHTWSIDDDEVVLEELEHQDAWQCIGQAIPSGWAFSRLQSADSGGRDLGGRHEHDDEIEVARLVVGEHEMILVSADRGTVLEIAAEVEQSLEGLIAPRSDALAA
jgi:hypothetical protein